MITPSSLEQEYEDLLNRDKTIYGTSKEKVTFDEKTGTLVRQRIDPLDEIKTGSQPTSSSETESK
jgi:hypothetical protein